MSSSHQPERGPMSSSSSQIGRLKSLSGMQPKDCADHKGLPRASVLVPLFHSKRDNKINNNNNNITCDCLSVLLTQRPLHLKSHPGEVCFPGGKQDPEDHGDDVETALREAWEEVGLNRNVIQLLCRLATVESRGVWQFGGQVSCSVVGGGIFAFRTYYYQYENPFDKTQTKTFKIFGLTAHVLHQVACLAVYGSLNEETEGVTAPTPLPQLMDRQKLCMEGSLWVWGGKCWREQYFVLMGGMLHQYASQEQANSKSSTAVKKNRLPLSDVQMTGIDDDDYSKRAFSISVLNGRIEWKLAAASDELRDRWINALSSG
ncbi:hypothetical protein MHU86_13251 [Fragilaria crotonensis]|nr:hypothetical protein MHU86_13251 [Fragilaria crotonensis]